MKTCYNCKYCKKQENQSYFCSCHNKTIDSKNKYFSVKLPLFPAIPIYDAIECGDVVCDNFAAAAHIRPDEWFKENRKNNRNIIRLYEILKKK